VLTRAVISGVPRARLRETLLLLVPFAGVPRTLDALTVLRSACPGEGVAEPGLPKDRAARRALFRERGEALFRRVYEDRAERVEARLRSLDPEIADWVLDDAYGKVLARSGLPDRDVECVAVVALTAQSLHNQLEGHMRGARNCGATRVDLEACLDAAAPWIDESDLDRARRLIGD
jgi:alkylhydroperoxidase/carboxymuconolactone decarboxylase family protein YurZ